jgi:hypothetical protein
MLCLLKIVFVPRCFIGKLSGKGDYEQMDQKHIGDSNFSFLALVCVKTLATIENLVKTEASPFVDFVHSMSFTDVWQCRRCENSAWCSKNKDFLMEYVLTAKCFSIA